MFLNLRSGSLRRHRNEIKGCATATMLTNCHTDANNDRVLNIRKRIPKFEAAVEHYRAIENREKAAAFRQEQLDTHLINNKVYEL